MGTAYADGSHATRFPDQATGVHPRVTDVPAGVTGGWMPGGLVQGSVGRMIEISQLTKRYGQTTAVRDLTFTVRPGHVTGFLARTVPGKAPPCG